MKRFLYGCLVRLHPQPFRERFGGEMMSVFEEAGGGGSLFADALASLARQWALRPDAWAAAGAAPRALDDVPLFYTAGSTLPRPGALFQGLVLSVAVFGAVSFAIGHWTTRRAPAIPFYGGSPWGGFHFAAPEPKPAPAFNPPDAAQVAAAYFPSVPVLAALDTDHDGSISAAEIAHAAATLKKLVKNNNRALARQDFLSALPRAAAAAPATRAVSTRAAAPLPVCVSFDAVFAALDTNHDGILSPLELRRAPAALKALDRNGDGVLSAEEVLPQTVCGP